MSALVPHLVLDNTMGAQLIGVVLAAGLFGVSCSQTWYYFTLYPNDRYYLRLLVSAVWFFDVSHQALISHTIYIYLIKNFANPAALGNLVWSLLVEVLFNGFTALLVQSFFAYRIWSLSGKNLKLIIVIASLILGEFAAVVVYTIRALYLHTFEELATLKHLSMVVNVLAAAGDVLIAATLCYILHRSKTGFRVSDTMINRLMAFCVNTGLLTSICAVMSLVSIVVWPNAFVYICFYFMLGRLYSNSLLATLNARRSIRGHNQDSDGFSMTIPSFQNTPALGMGSHIKKLPTALSIKVETMHERTSEAPHGRQHSGDTLQSKFGGKASSEFPQEMTIPQFRVYPSSTSVDIEMQGIDTMETKVDIPSSDSESKSMIVDAERGIPNPHYVTAIAELPQARCNKRLSQGVIARPDGRI